MARCFYIHARHQGGPRHDFDVVEHMVATTSASYVRRSIAIMSLSCLSALPTETRLSLIAALRRHGAPQHASAPDARGRVAQPCFISLFCVLGCKMRGVGRSLAGPLRRHHRTRRVRDVAEPSELQMRSGERADVEDATRNNNQRRHGRGTPAIKALRQRRQAPRRGRRGR